MTKTEYADYEQRFSDGTKDISFLSSGSYLESCSVCPRDLEYDDGVSYDCEPHFSWSTCDICARDQGGDRETAHGIYDGRTIHLNICTDCVYFNEYGKLDDMTMMELEESK